MRHVTTVVAMLLLSVSATAQFRYDSFAADSIDRVGSAIIALDTLVLTPALPGGQAGAAWHPTPQRITPRWSASVVFRITDRGGDDDPNGHDGGDGFALVIHAADPDDGRHLVGKTGYGIGYDGIRRSVAIELDLWDDSMLWGAWEDSSAHVAVMTRGRFQNSAIASIRDLFARVRKPVDDGAVHRLTVRYDQPYIAVWIDDCRMPVLVGEVDIPYMIGSDSAWIGLTAGTQSAWQRHAITSFCFGSCDPCARIDTVWRDVPVVIRDTIIRRDTVVRELWRTVFDTVYVAYRDTVWQRDTTIRLVRDTVTVERRLTDTLRIETVDTLRLVLRDSVWLVDTVVITRATIRDTCSGDSIIRVDTSVCAWQLRDMRVQRPLALSVAPNPTAGDVRLYISSPGSWSLVVTDAIGRTREVMRGETTAGGYVLRGLTTGAYTLTLRSNGERRTVVATVLR